ncbi:Alkaline phosphatase [Thermosinus carboxydivorans Nor1]|uniref:Alkaline phosphatase n=1 Tax=Thermosinus carboxydivorans Nor1 TaxID=401526 RepID=A1HMQ4_9FIRM|nr:alkaline phosphatase [Thermosinus carboxydivorans]EAX48541.1 Alkaline phosphatase [Thermosinus carboxydivorans Nor1]
MAKYFAKSRSVIWALVLCLVIGLSPGQPASAAAKAKNVIVLMADGTGAAHTTLARWYKGAPLALDEMYVSGVRTWAAESLITDSAPAATAFATGHKTSDKFIGVLPGNVTMPGVAKPAADLYAKPVATVLEGAKLMGKSTGLVATSNIQHASPAGYSSHWPDRNNYNEIGEQQVYLNIDVVLGGGMKYLLPKEQGGTRDDGENLMEVLKQRNYQLVETRDELLKVTSGKVWGMFAADDMAYDFDRKVLRPNEPSLAEMTQKAIELLSQNKKGFFLFVEGSKVDWASHANDPIGVISDLLAFDEAVKVALDFAKKDGNTIVLAFADHGNGGMSLGNKSTDKTYSKLPLSALVDPLKGAKLTGEGLEAMLGADTSEEKIRSIVADYYGVTDLTAEEVAAIQKAKKGQLNYVIGPIISKRSIIGWTTNGHTGEDLFFYYYGLNKPLAMIENTDIANICANALGFNLADVDAKLFVDAEKAFTAIGAKTFLDKSDANNPVLVVTKGAVKAELPLSKNLIKINGKVYQLNGIVVLAPKTGKVFLPQQAVELAKAAGM